MDIAFKVTSPLLIGLLIVWSFVNSKERPYQVRLNKYIQVFIIPLLIIFIYLIVERNLKIIQSG